MSRHVTDLPHARRARRLAAPALLVLILAVTAAVGACYLAGFRWFTVETPSMGSAAPVGTLVVTRPVSVEAVRVGEVIAFRPPTAPGRVYTHRIVRISPDGLETRGDINGAADGWRLHQADLVGSAVALVPGAGFLLRSVPLLLAGDAVLWLATRGIGGATVRAAVRTMGFGAVASLPGFVLHPFVQIQVLAVQPAADRISALIVSTGLLPVTVTAGTGRSLALSDGQVGTLVLPAVRGGYRLHADLDLPFWGWVALLVVCATPIAWSLIVGLPADREPAADEDATDRDRRGRVAMNPLRRLLPVRS